MKNVKMVLFGMVLFSSLCMFASESDDSHSPIVMRPTTSLNNTIELPLGSVADKAADGKRMHEKRAQKLAMLSVAGLGLSLSSLALQTYLGTPSNPRDAYIQAAGAVVAVSAGAGAVHQAYQADREFFSKNLCLSKAEQKKAD